MPKDGTIVPLFSGGTKGLSPVISAQRRTNLYVDAAQSDADKGRLALCGRPGFDYFTSVGLQTWHSGGVTARGMLRRSMNMTRTTAPVFSDPGFIAIGNSIATVTVSSKATVAEVFQMQTESGYVSFDNDTTYVVAVDGVTGYAVNANTLTGYTFATTGSAAGFPAGATTCCMLAGRMIVNKVNTGRFYWSSANDPLTWSSLDYATAEISPDNLLAVTVDHGELLLMGNTTTEFWSPSGGSQPFARVSGAALEYGITAIGSIVNMSDGTMFLARNAGGDTRVLMVAGSSGKPVSTPAIETEIEHMADPSGGIGTTLTANGRTFYLLSFDERTLAYNMTDGEWGYWQTGVNDGPWMAKFGSLIQGKYVAMDATRNRVYVMNSDSAYDGDDAIVREVVTKHVNADFDRTTIDRLGLDFETGVGSVAGSDPMVMLQVSRDNGRTWGNEVWASLGKLGNYGLRVWFRMLGRSRDWLFKIRWTDPVLTTLVGGSIKVRP